MVGKVLKTKAVFEAQTGEAVAEEIAGILQGYGVREKIVAVDNAGKHDCHNKNIVKIGCFARTLKHAVQKIHKCSIASNWATRVRAVVVWMKKSGMAKNPQTEAESPK